MRVAVRSIAWLGLSSFHDIRVTIDCFFNWRLLARFCTQLVYLAPARCFLLIFATLLGALAAIGGSRIPIATLCCGRPPW
jgi:hypothetical protein